MKIYHYCYTRGSHIDYGNFSYPNDIAKVFVDRIRFMALSILGDGVQRDLSIPKWILYKEKDFTVWGICCENRLLNSNKYVDHRNRPIRGFFAIIFEECNDADVKLPFDVEYFKQLYALEVEPYWEQQELHKNKTVGFIPGEYNYICSSTNNLAIHLNTDVFRCKSLGNVNKKDVLSAALALDNVSLLIDNDNLEQATNRGGSFMNCLSTNVLEGEYPVKQKCPKCGLYVSAFADGQICIDCKKKESKKKFEIKKEEDMDRKLKADLDVAARRIEDLESIIESDKKLLKKKNLLIRILLGVIIVLLLMLSYAYKDSLSVKIFGVDRDNKIERHQDAAVSQIEIG